MTFDLIRSRTHKALLSGMAGCLFAAGFAGAAPQAPSEDDAEAKAQAKAESIVRKAEMAAAAAAPPVPSARACALLDDPKARPIMDGLLSYLLKGCGRAHELGRVSNERVEIPGDEASAATPGGRLVGTDVPISDPSGDSGANVTQNETSMAYNPTTGTICAAHNDSFHGITENEGFSGFARSTDGGATFIDQGAIGPGNSGDPALVWRKADGLFYYAALSNGGLGIWRSTDDCLSFESIGPIVNSGSDDKELMAVDNNDGSLYFGRLYVHWTDFANGGIFSTHSDDEGSTWSTPVRMSATTGGVQGAWPAVAPNGDVYSSWVLFGTDTVTIEVVRSTDGGVTWNQVTNPVTDAAAPIDPTATANCFRTALNGNIRYLPSPQIAIGPNGDVHIVYSYDPDGTGPDTIDVFYRRSTDSGATWLPEIRVNDDTSDSDQFFPTLTVGDSNIVSISFYDRRNDPNNLLYEYFQATSPDGGASFLANVQVSDVQSDVTLDGALATCYHGDYDTHIQVAGAAILQWSDDRNNNADTFSDIVALGTDFLVIPDGSTATVCAPADGVLDLDVLQFNGFGEQVTLADSAWPAGLTASFGTNPVTPPNTSQLTISGTGNVAFGSYTLNVTGTSTPSSIVQDADVTLNVFTQTPPVSTLTAPADGSTNVALMPTLTWSAATEADLYDVEIATDSAFQDIVVQEQTSNTTIDVGSSLSSSTVYYWRVRPLNACGQAAFSQVSSFSTVPLPGDCPLGFENDDLAMEDFEAGVGGFTTGGTGSTWALQGASTNSGTMAFMADDVDDVTDQYLITPVYDLPSAADPLNLLFWTRIELEERGGGCFDGGVVEISSDGGATWTRLENEILLEAYDGPISDQFESPLANENAWCNTRDWTRFVVDLSAFAGESVQIRFRLATDISVGDNGWWIDDVSISTCGDGPIVFEDDFEGGSTGAWSSTVP